MQAGERRGFTLIELLISSALLTLLLTAIVAALYYCNRYLRASEAKIEAQAQTMKAVNWLARNLSEATPRAIKTAPGLGVSFASPRTPDGREVEFSGARLLWQQNSACYRTNDANNRPILLFKTFAYGSATIDPEEPRDLPLAIAQGANRTRVIARFIRQFEVEFYAPDFVEPPPFEPGSLRGCARIMIESFVPQYGLDYSVTVRTQVRLEN